MKGPCLAMVRDRAADYIDHVVASVNSPALGPSTRQSGLTQRPKRVFVSRMQQQRPSNDRTTRSSSHGQDHRTASPDHA